MGGILLGVRRQVRKDGTALTTRDARARFIARRRAVGALVFRSGGLAVIIRAVLIGSVLSAWEPVPWASCHRQSEIVLERPWSVPRPFCIYGFCDTTGSGMAPSPRKRGG